MGYSAIPKRYTRRRWRGWLMLLGPTLALISACSLGLAPSGSTLPTIPILRAPTFEGMCHQGGEDVPCVLMRRDDWRDVVRAMKAYCLAAGGTLAFCQAGE